MKMARKTKLLLMHIAILLVLTALVFVFAEEIQAAKKSVYYALRLDKRQPEATVAAYEDSTPLEPMANTGSEWYLKHRLIFHAGGQIQGHTYTNSLEAVEKTLAENAGGGGALLRSIWPTPATARWCASTSGQTLS